MAARHKLYQLLTSAQTLCISAGLLLLPVLLIPRTRLIFFPQLPSASRVHQCETQLETWKTGIGGGSLVMYLKPASVLLSQWDALWLSCVTTNDFSCYDSRTLHDALWCSWPHSSASFTHLCRFMCTTLTMLSLVGGYSMGDVCMRGHWQEAQTLTEGEPVLMRNCRFTPGTHGCHEMYVWDT